ncbi:unnamed protein product, partial [Bubo scandiacus]
MIALKPILQAWLEEAEKSHREKLAKPELFSGAEKKRKRTSIAAPEKRSLEAYFALQPRPLLREDRRHRREAGPQEERGPRLVLQPAPEAEAHEVLGRIYERELFSSSSERPFWPSV